jgi:hypothetical protein
VLPNEGNVHPFTWVDGAGRVHHVASRFEEPRRCVNQSPLLLRHLQFDARTFCHAVPVVPMLAIPVRALGILIMSEGRKSYRCSSASVMLHHDLDEFTNSQIHLSTNSPTKLHMGKSGAPRLRELVQRDAVDQARPQPKPRARAVQQHGVEALRREAPAATPGRLPSDARYVRRAPVADAA